jgi:hypothetical protein
VAFNGLKVLKLYFKVCPRLSIDVNLLWIDGRSTAGRLCLDTPLEISRSCSQLSSSSPFLVFKRGRRFSPASQSALGDCFWSGTRFWLQNFCFFLFLQQRNFIFLLYCKIDSGNNNNKTNKAYSQKQSTISDCRWYIYLITIHWSCPKRFICV